MKLKVHGGTRGGGGGGLCHSCSNAHVRRGAAIGQEVITCKDASWEAPHVITYPIVECNGFRDRSLPNLHDMTKIATFINADRKTGTIGFSSPEQDKKNNVDRDQPDDPFDT